MDGAEGIPGLLGDPGDLILPPGTKGQRGLGGDQGYPGIPGYDGTPGAKGNLGYPGFPGRKGEPVIWFFSLQIVFGNECISHTCSIVNRDTAFITFSSKRFI